jgi:hypothetical protein
VIQNRLTLLARFAATAALASLGAIPSLAQTTATGYNNVTATVSGNGAWSISVPATGWHFAGSLGASALAPHINDGTDTLGAFEEVAFTYSIASSSRSASIRLYAGRPLALFNITYNSAAANTAPFPSLSSFPALSHLSFNGMFAGPDFVNLNSDSPWAFFDGSANTFILSPAANYMTAEMDLVSAQSIKSGISGQIGSLPAGFTHSTALVFGQGINNTFATWGQAITDLGGKTRPSNSADVLLKNISYWTDNGASYYYNSGATPYMTTLDSVRAEFASKGVTLGSLQLDSWWYPKGPDNSWSSNQGIWTYTAAPGLFTPDLATFQAGLKVSLITHARWIDAASPYRSQYTISNNVATDPAYWESVGTYIKASGAAIYEQDWLGSNAQSNLNLTDPNAFLGNMAASMASRGIDIQYCMALPKHFMQSSQYSNVTSIRTSQDRFGSDKWTAFFYSSRFASALGAWPFSDVFMSGETSNMIAAVLSAGPVGVGDALGNLSRLNLARAARADGVLVKPDVAATPVDSVIANDARGVDVPMVASSYSDFGGLRGNYIFAYPRVANTMLTIAPSDYGISGASYLYNYLTKTVSYLAPGSVFTAGLPSGASYFVLVAEGTSGIAFLGDAGHFATLGKQRIASLSDNGTLDLKVNFAAGETARTLTGFSANPLAVTSVAGSHKTPSWDAVSQTFTVTVHPSATGVAHLQMTAPSVSAQPAAACASRCTH